MIEILDGSRNIDAVSESRANSDQNFIASGRVVVGGRRVGPIRVIQHDSEWGTVKPGEIVACQMTKPEFVMAVESIAGLITEQGGLLCHAAILAREFNIPCVVGCGSFLSEVRAGQVVELDASHGILLGQKVGDMKTSSEGV